MATGDRNDDYIGSKVIEAIGICLRSNSAFSSFMDHNDERLCHSIRRGAGGGEVGRTTGQNRSATFAPHSFQTGTRLEFLSPGRRDELGRKPGSCRTVAQKCGASRHRSETIAAGFERRSATRIRPDAKQPSGSAGSPGSKSRKASAALLSASL